MLKKIRPIWLLSAVVFVVILIVAGFSNFAGSPRALPLSSSMSSGAMIPSATAMSVVAEPTSAAIRQDQPGNKSLTAQTGQNIPKPVQQRVVLKNATLNLTVDNPAQSITAITQMAEQMGGWVVASNATTTDRGGQRLAQATISIRVPAEQFATVLERIKAGAISVDTENIAGDDVTQQYVDLTSQVSNLEATEAQLQKIMSTATDVTDVLAVQNRLTEVQGQIDGINGRLKYFSEAASYSLITLTLTQKAAPPPPVPTAAPRPLGLDNWQPAQIVQNAADILIGGAQIVLSILIFLIIIAGPIVIPVVIMAYLLRRFRARPVVKPPQVQAE